MSDPLLAKILKERGGKLVDQAVDRLLANGAGERPSLTGKLARAALLRIASRSVPGAIVVGGGLLAKHLHDKRKAARAKAAPASGGRPDTEMAKKGA